jgi:hypothetical protein
MQSMRIRTLFPIIAVALNLSCAGHNTLTSPNIAGAYEFVVTSNVTGGVTLVEANLAANGDQSTGSGPSQVQILTLEKKIWYVNGSCPGSTPGQNSVSTSANGNQIAVTFNEGGNALSAQGTLAGSVISANYAISGSSCPDLTGTTDFPPGVDQGGIVGNQVANLAGTFSGTLILPNGVDDAVLTLTENSDRTLSVNVSLTGPVDNGSFVFTGTAIGNTLFASGTVSGRNLTLLGYYDRAGTYSKLPNSLLVFDYDTAGNAGVLLGQP